MFLSETGSREERRQMPGPQPDGTVLKLRRDAVDWLDVDGEIVILDMNKSRYMSINHSGAEIWRLLNRGATRQQLIDNLKELYGIDDDQATTDVDGFLSALSEHGLLEGGG